MTKNEIEKVLKLAGKAADLTTAALKFLGIDKADGSESAVNGVVDEVTQWKKASQKKRSQIEEYKNCKSADHDEAAAAAAGELAATGS